MVILDVIGSFLSGDGGRWMYLFFAIAGSAYFGISGVLYLFGFGGVSDMPGDIDLDMDGSIDIPHPDTGFPDFRFLSLRTILAFIMMFGWGGLIFGREYPIAGFIGAVICGLAAMALTAFVIGLLLKLQQSGTKNSAQMIGLTGKVYLTIPADRKKAGKVVVNAGDDTREITAFSEEELATGTPVKVVSCIGQRQFIVEKL